MKPPCTPLFSSVQITEPKGKGVLIRATETSYLSVAICGNCGYTEHHVEDHARLWKYWQKGYR